MTGKVIQIDAELHNADWSKQTLDLFNITTLPELLAFLKASGSSLEDFMALPVFRLHRKHWAKVMARE